MNIAKKMVYFWVFLILSSFVCADMVYILNLHYEGGSITLIDKKVDYGISPDRLIQPEFGFRAELVDFNDDKLESFRFAAPNEMFVDYSSEGELHGGIIILDKTDFALVVPYYEELKEIKFYNKENMIISSVIVEDEKLAPSSAYGYLAGVLVLVGIIVWMWKRKK